MVYNQSCLGGVPDQAFMQRALTEADKARKRGEVPVGAVLVDDKGHMLAAAGNRCIEYNDPTAHAEIVALRQAGQRVGNYRLPGTTLYVTLEPCAMCASAMVHARLERVVFGVRDPKAGAIVSVYNIGTDGALNHYLQVDEGLFAEACGQLLREFFRQKRQCAARRP